MADFKTISVDDLRASKTNPRKTFGESALLELAESIKTQGILQPILVRPSKDQYEIVCGERRFRAARIAGLKRVPCIVRSMTDAEVLDAQIVENLQRQDVHPLEESACIVKLLKSKIYQSEQAVADKIGRPVEFVRRRLKLSDLHKSVKKALEEEQITIGWAELVSTIPPKDQVEAFTQMGYWSGPKTVADLKNWIKSRFRHQELTNANFDLDDLTLLPVAGSCLICPKNSINGLFPEGGAICSDAECFRAKTDAFNERKIAKAKEEHPDAVELSWSYGNQTRGLEAGKWRTSEDEDAEIGIFVEGGRIGEVVRFKRTEFLDRSNPSNDQSRAERKAEIKERRIEQLFRFRLYEAIMAEEHWPLVAPLIAELLFALCSNRTHLSRGGIQPDRLPESPDIHLSDLPNMSAQDKLKHALMVKGKEECIYHDYCLHQCPALLAFADFFSIDVDLIRREAEIELMTKKEKKEAGIA